jgi:hypothetical protein
MIMSHAGLGIKNDCAGETGRDLPDPELFVLLALSSYLYISSADQMLMD